MGPASCQGVGVHTGHTMTLNLLPALQNTGIIFERTDVAENNQITANWKNVNDTRFCTQIANEHGITISTIEHLMAALWACEIDNVIVQLNGPEMPIMDGSSTQFIDLIESAGIKEQSAPRQYLRVLKPISIKEDKRQVSLLPAFNFTLDCSVDFNKRQDMKPQTSSFSGNGETFKKQFSQARTYGFVEDVEKLYSMGLAKGASLENAIGIKDGKVANPEGLRYTNEMARHKILDAIGDLYLAGAPIIGHYVGHNSGHEFNNKILEVLMSDPDAWTLETPTQSETHQWVLQSSYAPQFQTALSV